MSDSYSSLGDRLEGLLQVETFPPPAGFAARAQVRDPRDPSVLAQLQGDARTGR